MPSFKAGTTGIHTLGNTVTLAQVLPTRTTQGVLYNANSTAQFNPTARITVTTTASNPRPTQTRTIVSISICMFYFSKSNLF